MQTAELVAGRELDALVAEKVMGFRWVPTTSNSEQRLLAPPEMTDEAVDQAIGLGHAVTKLAPPYSTDIAAAWQVVSQLNKQGYGAEITGYPDGSARTLVQHGYACIADESAETASLAICKAALAAIGH